jgi:hypothetical protein
MSGLTDQDARALTFLACRIRKETKGAREWDEAGTFAEIAKLVGQNLPIACERVLRHAADVDAKTPGAIRRPFLPDAPKAETWRPLKPEEACRNCGLAKHPANAECDGRPPAKTADVTAPVAHLRALRDEASAELCSHGVKRTNCLDHRASDAHQPSTEQGADHG